PCKGSFIELRRLSHFACHLDINVSNARQCFNQRNRFVTHLVLHRAGRSGEVEIKRYFAALDLQITDEAQRDNILAKIGVLNTFQNSEYLLLGHTRVLFIFVPKSHDLIVTDWRPVISAGEPRKLTDRRTSKPGLIQRRKSATKGTKSTKESKSF